MTSPTWRKSSRSTEGTSGQCVEVTRFGGTIGMRDSKNPQVAVLKITPAEFATLTQRIKSNDLDL